MLLNGFEKLMMNNPVRAVLQRHYEARKLLAMGAALPGGKVLEVGCGRGVGTSIILDVFGAETVDAFDYDRHMVGLAQRRHAARKNVRLWHGDVSVIAAPDNHYDAAFNFGIIHHVPDWRAALREVYRVLKPGGRFYAEEVLAHFILHPLWRRLCDHPMQDRFDQRAFHEALETCGFQSVDSKPFFKDFAFFIANKPG